MKLERKPHAGSAWEQLLANRGGGAYRLNMCEESQSERDHLQTRVDIITREKRDAEALPKI